LLGALHKLHPCENLALSGGCAMNSVANGKVYRRTAFKKMYLPAAAGDAGGAIGAAAFVQSQLDKTGGQRTEAREQVAAIDPNRHQEVAASDLNRHPASRIQDPASGSSYELRAPNSRLDAPSSLLPALMSAYLGPGFTHEEIHALLDWRRNEIADAQCSTSFIGYDEDLLRRTATAIADGKVVGWFQGRMEWGPRALGNRSILADPRRADIRELLNAKIKRRESFRPFAPSILRESVSEWFEQDDDVPFMMEVFQIRPKHRELVPAVTHVDGSGRLHTVDKAINPRYHALISIFSSLTSIPMVLNTSFNENEPVVCYPEEALDCFLRTKMDVLVLGNFFLERSSVEKSNGAAERPNGTIAQTETAPSELSN
jgi:carbamoyltransferase